MRSIRNKKRFVVIITFILALVSTKNVLASTGTSYEQPVTLTVHVIDNEPDSPSQNIPDEPDTPPTNETDMPSSSDTIDPLDEDGDIKVPDTGNPTSLIGTVVSQYKLPLAIFAILLVLAVVKILFFRVSRNGFAINRTGRNNSFRIKNKLYSNIIKITAVLGVIALAQSCLSINNSPEQVEAVASSDYPYSISLDANSEHDIYVKRGETAETNFDIKTTTDNETGYILTMSAESNTLLHDGFTIDSVAEDTALSEMEDNTWGMSVDGSIYSPIPSNSGLMILDNYNNATPAAGRSTSLRFAVKVNNDIPLGDYVVSLNVKSETNKVYRKLTLANGNVATVQRVSDRTNLSDGADLLLGEELKVSDTEDVAGILQDIVVNGDIVENGHTFAVTKNTTVSTWDDSVHFLKNSYKPGSTTAYGYGDAILVKSKGKYWMIDTGMPNDVDYGGANGVSFAEYLDALNIKNVDYLLLTHAHADHTGGLEYLINNNYISANTKVYMRGCTAVQTEGGNNYTSQCQGILRNILSKVNKNNITTIVANNMPASDGFADKTTAEYANIRNTLKTSGVDFGNFHVSFYNIDSTYSTNRENANSIGTKFVYTPNSKSFFTGGDFELPNEVAYASAIGKVDVLKVGHHGGKSASSKEFLDILQPKDTIVTNMDEPDDQVAAWAYLHYQKSGDVYFTGNSTGRAIAVDFDESYSQGYKVNKATKKTTFASEAYWYYWDWSSGSVGSYETPGSFCRFYYTYVSGGSLTINNNGKTCSYTKENLWR